MKNHITRSHRIITAYYIDYLSRAITKEELEKLTGLEYNKILKAVDQVYQNFKRGYTC